MASIVASRRCPIRPIDSRRRHHGAPVLELDVDALLPQRRHRKARKTLAARDGQRPHRARLDLRRKLREPVDPRRDLAADDGRQRLAAAGEGDVVHARRRDAHGLGDEAGEDLVAASGGSAAPGDRLRPLLECGQQLLQRPVRRGRGDDDHFVLTRQPRQRRGIAQRHRRLVRDDPAEHDEAGDQHGVAVAAFGADEARQADRAGRAGDVLDRRRPHDARLLQHLLHHARGLIPAAAGRRRRDDAQGA